MAFVLEKLDDMKVIYETAKKVYKRELAVSAAVKELSPKTAAKESSLQMYFNIYSCMRSGKTYKMGTSEAFTQFLLEQILQDEGEEAFKLALTAVKGNAVYRKSKNNAQPGLQRACINAIKKSGLSIDYTSIPVSDLTESTRISILTSDLDKLKASINLPNAGYAKTIMEMLEKHQVLTEEEISLLTDRAYCSQNFSSSFPMLKAIEPNLTVEEQIKDSYGRNRYYGSTYTLLGRQFVFTSQLYGLGNSPTTRDNRAPFLKWLLDRFATAEVTIETDKISTEGGEEEVTIKEKVDAIKSYIAARGFNYERDLIENFYLSLKSKPFVILAGTSGTGKTRLVKLFAEAIGAKMQLVPVRPDWSDSSDLFGHNDLSGKFHPGAIIDFIKQAEWDKSTPHFLCLDEMNLARVEYYLSDFLSIIETRDRKENGAIETDALIDASYFQSQSAREKYGKVYIPENLYVIGTVNMDETTFPFSKKVLDRANTIEFSFVNLLSRVAVDGQVAAQKLDNSFLKTDYLYLQECDDEDFIDTICFNLEELNQILVKANLHVGYRVRDEISFYMMSNKKAKLLDFDVAFDHEIMQKIFPRIQGSSVAIKNVLSELFAKCAGDYSGFAGATAYEQMNSYLESKTCKYPNSAKKIAFMMRRYEEDGFTSYWL